MKAFKDLVGKTCSAVIHTKRDEIVFSLEDGSEWVLNHEQNCCEDVYIESVVGELSDLVNTPILVAEETSGRIEDADESGTWTFYKLATAKGWVDVRWNGYSNGYYSEDVGFDCIKEAPVKGPV